MSPRKISEAMKKKIAGKQHYKCANKPKANLAGIGRYKCNLWKLQGKHSGSFDEAGYEIDHIKEYSRSKNSHEKNLQALCKACHSVKTKSFLMKKKEPKIKIDSDVDDSDESIESSCDSESESEDTDTKTKQYRCSNCGIKGHNIRTCCRPSIKRQYQCSNCGGMGHNIRTCKKKYFKKKHF